MTAPDDVTANYLRLMAERGWTFDDLADEFDRQAAGPPPHLDGGAGTRHLAEWARREAAAERRRQAGAESPARDLRPDQATPEPPRRTTTAGRPGRRG